ncbi:hypothetical protein ZWY2020_010482 [Hordeum vulgare]|nr:hypothetical protein ZWY2020_010482 [Hordeum vulgare]
MTKASRFLQPSLSPPPRRPIHGRSKSWPYPGLLLATPSSPTPSAHHPTRAANGHARGHDGHDDPCAAASVCDGGGDPFAFLSEDRRPPRPPGPSPADPFRNRTPALGGLYGWVRTLLLAPVAVVRLVLFGLSIAIGYAATWVALRGWTDSRERSREGAGPMPAWRRRLMWVTRLSARCILFSFGYHWITRKGRPAPRELAPIVVSNHVSYIDPIYFFYELFPTIVSSVIYVDRFSPASRKSAVNEIKRKAAGNSFPRVLLFPEGTTTNGRFLISFQHGAFIPGYPVQPVVVRYPHVHFDQSCYAYNVLPTSYSYADSMIASRAEEAGKANCSSYMVEMAWVKEVYGVSTAEAMELLEHFLAMNPDSDGRVKAQDFWALFGLDCSPLCKKIFHYFDFENKESITFRQFLVVCAPQKQPLFEGVCETAFEKCKAPGTSDISLAQLANALRSGMVPPADDGMLKLFKMFDIGGGDKISKDDFVGCLARFPFMIALFAGRINGEVYIEIV